MSHSDTVDLVKKVLQNNTEIRDWYEKQFNFTIDMVDIAAVSTSTYGDLCYQILIDGHERNIITDEEFEGA